MRRRDMNNGRTRGANSAFSWGEWGELMKRCFRY
ncbi:unnamed protein product [Amoebophrya sp. A25]|nr:unnamed protein product [Amoebophrya sp. A25]|eukprot:GSA25T00006068001.1